MILRSLSPVGYGVEQLASDAHSGFNHVTTGKQLIFSGL